MPNARKYAYSRLFPVAPAFTETGVLALEGQRRVLECMIDERVDGICILAHCSEQFLLSEHLQSSAPAMRPRVAQAY